MKAKVIIRNFGPVHDIDIEIRKFNILIGPHASGKSTISKVLCVIHSFDYAISFASKGTRDAELLKQFLVYYRIENFHNANTYWFFEDDLLKFELKDAKISIIHKKNLDETSRQMESYYFPAERIALPMISESLFELNLSDSPLPKYFLQFGNDFIKAKKEQKIFNLSLLDLEFQYSNGKDLITLRNNKDLLLEETSSAIQANLPLLVILQYPIKTASLFVIEELELHGFPLLQKKLFYYVIERMKHPKLKKSYLMLPTHSPYLLSAANNLLFAGKMGKQQEKDADNIIPNGSWIEPEKFSAYYISEGTAKSIVDKETGLIHENELDTVSEDLASEFDSLMQVYKPMTND